MRKRLILLTRSKGKYIFLILVCVFLLIIFYIRSVLNRALSSMLAFGHCLRFKKRQQLLGFTLLEVLLAVSIFSIVSGVTYFSFAVATTAWRRGVEMTDRMHHADFAVEQIVMALRSMYYPLTGTDASYGFWHDDRGRGKGSFDMISWVKLGASLVGRNAKFLGGAHRIKITMEPDKDHNNSIMVRSWGLLSEVDGFKSENLQPKKYGVRILGLDCRFEDPEGEFENEIAWIDEWEKTNTIPRAIELTIFLEPIEDGDKPLEVKRFIEIPLGESVWGKRHESTIAGRAGPSEADSRRGKEGKVQGTKSPSPFGADRAPGSTRLPKTS